MTIGQVEGSESEVTTKGHVLRSAARAARPRRELQRGDFKDCERGCQTFDEQRSWRPGGRTNCLPVWRERFDDGSAVPDHRNDAWVTRKCLPIEFDPLAR
jgi:hypothetical protein